MNPASRLNKLLVRMKIINHQGSPAIKVFEILFNVQGIIAITGKLKMCNMQIKKLENKSSPKLIKYLKKLFNDNDICRDIASDIGQKDNFVMTLESVAHHMKNENIDEKELKELADLIEQMKAKIEKADLSNEAREFLYAYTDEIMEGIVDIHIGGMDSLNDHLIKATGIYIIHRQAFERSQLIEAANKVFKIATKLINFSEIFTESIGYISDTVESIEYIGEESLKDKEECIEVDIVEDKNK